MRPITLATATIASIILANTARASDAVDSAPQLKEVVVTAEKRAENVQTVPVSVTALSGAQMNALQISQPVDLAAQTAGLFAKTTAGNSAPLFYIRGIGLNDFFSNSDPSVSVYVDQALVPYSPMLSFAIFDTKQVEVLKGPQGTLYGRNNTGGAINFVTNKPTDQTEAFVHAQYGNFADRRIEAALGGPIGRTLSGRIAISAHRGGAFQTDEYTGRHVGASDDWAARGMLRWRPTSLWDLLLNVHGGQDRGEDQWFKLANSQNPKNPFQTCAAALAGNLVYDGTCTDIAGHYDPNPNVDYVGGSNPFFGTQKNNRTYGVSLTAQYNLPRATFTSISAWDWFRRHEPISYDGTPYVTVNALYDEHIWSVEEEDRLTSDDSWAFQWITGVFFSSDAIGGRQDLQGDDSVPLLTGIPAPLGSFQQYEQRTRSYAVFGQTNWPLTSSWHLTTGARFTHEARDFIGGSTFVQDYVNLIPLSQTNNSISANDLSGKIALQYILTDRVMFYGSVSKGFKSGGFNAAFSSNPLQLAPYRPEKLWAVELGEKSTLFDGRLTLDAAAYNYWWKDFQAQIIEASSTGIPLQILANAGNARNYGFEIDSAWRPIRGLELQVNANLLHTLITSGPYSGEGLSNAPKATVGAVVHYELPLGTAPLKLQMQVDGNAQSGVRFRLTQTVAALGYQSGFGIVNAHIAIGARDEVWTVSIWGRNLADKRHLVDVFDQSPINVLQIWNAPRTFGVSLDYRFQ